MLRRFSSVLLVVAVAVFLALAESRATRAQAEPFAPLSSNADWQVQDWQDSRGIAQARLEAGRLVLTAHLLGRDAQYAKGEVYLDLRTYPRLSGLAPVDLGKHTVTVVVEVPEGFVGPHWAPNGAQVFVKDASSRSQYSGWQNIETGGRYVLTLTPSARGEDSGYTAPGFDPHAITIIGVKFAIGSESSDTYDGPLSVTRVAIAPPILLSDPAPLPASPPPPILSPNDAVTVKPDGLYLNGVTKWFVVGGNWRGLQYGQNFGATKWFPTGNGVSKHPNFVRAEFDDFRRAGIKVLRIGLLDDGRTMFDREGRVTGYEEASAKVFRSDVRTLLDVARQAGMRVEFALMDFPLAGKGGDVDGVWVQGRAALIADPARTEEFLSGLLIPFLKEFGKHPALFGFDLMNEPEWVVAIAGGGGWEDVKLNNSTRADGPIPAERLTAFWARCADAIHTYAPGRLVTLGVSCTHLPFARLALADYSALHHYDWMDARIGGLESFAARLPKGKPWLLEEYPTRGAKRSITRYLDLVLAGGGSGAMLWNLMPAIDDQTFPYAQRNGVLRELRKWVDAHPPAIVKARVPAAKVAPAKAAVHRRRPKGPAAIGSPDGDVPFGAKAYSPDGLLFAREVEPRGHGRIGVFDVVSHQRVRVLDTNQHPQGDYPNELKGLAWSPDSTRLAVMYHHFDGGHISVVRVKDGQEMKWIDFDGWPHDLSYSRDGKHLRAGSRNFAVK